MFERAAIEGGLFPDDVQSWLTGARLERSLGSVENERYPTALQTRHGRTVGRRVRSLMSAAKGFMGQALQSNGRKGSLARASGHHDIRTCAT